MQPWLRLQLRTQRDFVVERGRYRLWRDEIDDDVPVAADPTWTERTQALLAFVRSARTWDELKAWAKAQGRTQAYLRQQLAYLSLQGRARCMRDNDCSWKATSR